MPNDVRLDRVRPDAKHDVGSGEARELVAQGAEVPPVGIDPQRPDERRHASSHVDDRGAGAQGFAVEVQHDQPGLFAMGQGQLNPLAGVGVSGAAGFDQQGHVPWSRIQTRSSVGL